MSVTLAEPVQVVPARPRPQLRLVPPISAAPYQALQRPQRPLQPCDPRPVAANFALGVAEVMARARPVDQLRDLATFEVVRMIERVAARQPHHPHRSVPQPRLRSVHLASPCAGVIEACAVIDAGTRTRALAFRLEHNGNAWRATVVQLG